MLLKQEINEYLFYEFGFDIEEDEKKISPEFPFKLGLVGEFQIEDIYNFTIYEFVDGDEEFYVLFGKSICYFKKNGMDIQDLYYQQVGSYWIGKQNPIDLNTTCIGKENIPPVCERRKEIEKLVWEKCGMNSAFKIVEGLFLSNINKYVAIIEYTSGQRIILGNFINLEIEGFEDLPAWRCLSWGVGKVICRKNLEEEGHPWQ